MEKWYDDMVLYGANVAVRMVRPEKVCTSLRRIIIH